MPQPLGPNKPESLAAADVDGDVAEQRPVVGLGQALRPGPRCRRSARRRESPSAERRSPAAARPVPLDPLQLLAAVLGLGVLLAVGVAADEILRLLDFDLLLLVGPRLDQQPLGLLLPVGREVAGVRLDRAVEQLQRAVGHLVEEVAVVADDDHRRRAFQQELFEPLGGLDVEVVRRLVEDHQVRLGQQQLGQHQAVLLAAAEGRDRLLERLRRKSQAVEHALDLVVEVVGVLAVQFVLEMIVAGGQPPLLGRIGRRAISSATATASCSRAIKIGQCVLGLFVQGAPGLERGCCSR